MKMATTAVELITDPIAATAPMMSTISRCSRVPPLCSSQSPTAWAAPVRTSPSPITNRQAIRIRLGLEKPAIASR